MIHSHHGGLLGGGGAVWYCPNCMYKLERALPVEPLFTREEVCAMVPCLTNWLYRKQREPWISEPIYMQDNRRRVLRMFTATDVRNLRIARQAKYTKRKRTEEPPYEWPAKEKGYATESGELPRAESYGS